MPDRVFEIGDLVIPKESTLVLSQREAILRQTPMPVLEFLTMRDALASAAVSWNLCELVSPHISAFVRQDGGEVSSWTAESEPMGACLQEDEVIKHTGHTGYVAADTSDCKQQ